MAGKEVSTPQYIQDIFLETRTFEDVKAIKCGAGYKNGTLLFTKDQKRTARTEMESYQAFILEDAIIAHVKKAKDATKRATRLNALSDLSALKIREAFVHDDGFWISEKDINDKRLAINDKKDANPVYKREYNGAVRLLTDYEQKQCGGEDPILTQKQFYWNLGMIDAKVFNFPKGHLISIPQQSQDSTQK